MLEVRTRNRCYRNQPLCGRYKTVAF